MTGLTLFEKIWREHSVVDLDDGFSLVYLDRIFLHERTGSIALKSLQQDNRKVLNPSSVMCVMDHIVDTFPPAPGDPRSDETLMPQGKAFIEATRKAAQEAGITLVDINDPRQGISHIVASEQGMVLPGSTIICPDSHTCTLGALGALAWGVGSSQAEHGLATQTQRLKKPQTMRVRFEGELQDYVSAKDLVLHLIAEYGASGGSGYAIEFAGPAIEALSVEARMTLCNMAVEFSAFTGIIGVDEKTIDYVKGKTHAPNEGSDEWNAALQHWLSLRSDADAEFDKEIVIDCGDISPTATWGTSPQHAISIDGVVPDPVICSDDTSRASMQRALNYMNVKAESRLEDLSIDAAFIGSCTNSRLSDLRIAAEILKGKRIKSNVKAVCVPGSTQIKAAAEAEGLDKIFKDAGFEWREAGCSMCFYAGGETFGPGKRVISTTNRNFEGRQGPNTLTHLASPATVAASALTGKIT